MRPGVAATVAGLVGFAMMGLELTAIRLMAPHFGDSAYVWTNVIGVMLVALALGAWLGGRWAGVPQPGRRLAVALVAAGTLTTAAPLLVAPLGAWLVPQTLPLEAAMAALVRGSLACTLALFAPPVLLLGVTTPMLVAMLVHGGRSVGSASGMVSALSTLGCLAGTFAATHLLVPGLGSRASVWVFALVLFVCAALVARGIAPAAGAALALVLASLPGGIRRPPPAGAELLAERESAYQFLQVLRRVEDGVSVTSLKINEGLDSFHSLARSDGAWTAGAYYDWHAAAPVLARGTASGEGLRVLSLGSAAATFSRLFGVAYPGCTVDGVEIDAAVVELGERYFGGRGAAGRDFAGVDARVFVELSSAEYDVALVDAYARQIYVPAHVASREFFRALRARLVSGGIVSVNVGGLGFDDPVLTALAGTMAAVFGEAHAFRVPFSRNFVLMARRDLPLDRETLRAVGSAGPELTRVLTRMADAAHWRTFGPGGRVLDDDRPVLDALQHASLRATERATELVDARGDGAPDAVADVARDHLLAGRAEACLEAIATAREVTAYLRILAADARWALHDARGALGELSAAEAAGLPDGLTAHVAQRRETFASFLAGIDAARGVGARNGLCAGLLTLALLGVAHALARRSA